MKKIFAAAFLTVAVLSVNALAQTYLQQIAGNWQGTLEYQDYSADKRVKLTTYLTVKPNSDETSAEFLTVYDDFGRIIKSKETVTIDLSAKKYFAGKTEYQIDSAENGKIVLLGSGQDGEKVEPIRQTIFYSNDSLNILKETRTPWQFRNQLIFKRAAENVLAKRTLTPAQMTEDFEVLKKSFITLHPGIYRYQTPASLEKLFGELQLKLQKPLSEGDFYILLSQFTNQIYCGHTYLNPYNQNGLVRERLFNGKTYLPFYFQIIDNKMIITENASSQNLARGSEIKRINGVSAKQIIKTLLTVTKADGKNTLAHRLDSIKLNRFEAERYALFDWYFPLFFPLQNETFNLEAVDAATKKTVKFQTSPMTKDERTAEMAKRYGAAPTYDDNWKFEIQENATAYLKIPNSITWRLKKIKFKEFIADAFSQMRASNVKYLIIDLRGNGGGDMSVGFELARHLAKEKLPVYAEGKRLVRNVAAQTELVKYLETYSDNLKLRLQNGISPDAYKKIENGYFEILLSSMGFPNVTPYENSFNGKAFIIADSGNASATFQFLDYAKTNKLATIVGQESGGNLQGINGGNYYFLRLPNSKFEIDIPFTFYLPPMTRQDAGVLPDVYIKSKIEDVVKNIDTEVTAIRKLIENEEKQSSRSGKGND
jgi:C-terminal processing protease CtpA/Prc